MRAHARAKGYTLSEYCVRTVTGGGTGKKATPEVFGEPIAVASERDVFDLIGFPWVPSTQRET
jgi:DNA polymerase/3'-5' exonuclease PolX